MYLTSLLMSALEKICIFSIYLSDLDHGPSSFLPLVAKIGVKKPLVGIFGTCRPPKAKRVFQWPVTSTALKARPYCHNVPEWGM